MDFQSFGGGGGGAVRRASKGKQRRSSILKSPKKRNPLGPLENHARRRESKKARQSLSRRVSFAPKEELNNVREYKPNPKEWQSEPLNVTQAVSPINPGASTQVNTLSTIQSATNTIAASSTVNMDDGGMEQTMCIGGIIPIASSDAVEDNGMEMTTCVGNVLIAQTDNDRKSMGMEETVVVGKILSAVAVEGENDQMELTKSVASEISTNPVSTTATHPEPPRISSHYQPTDSEGMDFTSCVGGTIPLKSARPSTGGADMEQTMAVGQILGSANAAPSVRPSSIGGADMEQTMAVGQIIGSIVEAESDGMDMTTCVGRTIATSNATQSDEGSMDMEQTVAVGNILFQQESVKNSKPVLAPIANSMTSGSARLSARKSKRKSIGTMDMDETRPVGQILAMAKNNKRVSRSPAQPIRRTPTRACKRRSIATSPASNMVMEQTVNVGKILIDNTQMEEKDVAMEITSNVGQLLGNINEPEEQELTGDSTRHSTSSMEFTSQTGTINGFDNVLSLSNISNETQPSFTDDSGMVKLRDEMITPEVPAEPESSSLNPKVQKVQEQLQQIRRRQTLTKLDSIEVVTAHTDEPATASKETYDASETENTNAADDKVKESSAERTSDVEDEEEQEPMTFGDYLEVANIRFLDKVTNKRRTTMAGHMAPMPSTLAGIAKAGFLMQPELDTYTWGTEYLSKVTEDLKQNLPHMEQEVMQANSEYFEAIQHFDEDELMDLQSNMKSLKQISRQEAKARWHAWRVKWETAIKNNLTEEVVAIQDDIKTIETYEALLEDQRQKAETVKESLSNQIAEIEPDILSAEEFDAAVAGQSDRRTAAQQCAEAEMSCTEVEDENVELKAEIDALLARKAQVEANIEESKAMLSQSCSTKSSTLQQSWNTYQVLCGLAGFSVLSASGSHLKFQVGTHTLEVILGSDSFPQPIVDVNFNISGSPMLKAALRICNIPSTLINTTVTSLPKNLDKVLFDISRAESTIKDLSIASLLNEVQIVSDSDSVAAQVTFVSYVARCKFTALFSVFSKSDDFKTSHSLEIKNCFGSVPVARIQEAATETLCGPHPILTTIQQIRRTISQEVHGAK